MSIFRFIIVLSCALISTVSSTYASTNVEVGDELYYVLSRLEAEGVITSSLLSIKPISRKDAIRLLHEAESNAEGKSEFITSLIRLLRERLKTEDATGMTFKPIDTVYAGYVNNDADIITLQYANARENEQALNNNNDGDVYKRGANFRAGFTSRMENLGPFSVYLNPEFRYPDSPASSDQFVVKKAYGVLSVSGIDIIAGKEPQWWGPGYHGALLLTNNAEPLTAVRFTNPEPAVLPWFLKGLGPFKFAFIVSQLEKERRISEPMLWGLRFAFKPDPVIEIGLERTALLGGHGRPDDLGIWWHSFYGGGNADNCWENCYREPGDQRAGLDFKLTLPFQVQPVQIYLEADGEDEYGWRPNLWAFVGGVYLPRILDADRIDLRMEYAITRGRQHTPYTWYTHSRYDSYTYNGMIIGHHIGTDADDIFVETSYLIPESNSRMYLNFDREEHDLYVNRSNEVTYEVSVGLQSSLAKNVVLTASYGHGWIRNAGNIPQETMQVNALSGQLSYTY